MIDIDPALTIVGVIAGVAAVALTWFIAKKQGVFGQTDVRATLFGMDEGKHAYPEVVLGGPHAQQDILAPVLIQISNQGTVTATDIEVTVEGSSIAVVNHPSFFISPVATKSVETIEGQASYLGHGIFRRVFRIASLHSGKSVQLNNAGLPGNDLRDGSPYSHTRIEVTIYENGKSVRSCNFGVWVLDTSKCSFANAVRDMAEGLKSEYTSKPFYQRMTRWLRSKDHEHQLLFMDVTSVRPVPISSEPGTFFTVDKYNVSHGCRFFTGNVMWGPIGLL